ncbi:hypothetical protein [Nonomuraea endophytica]|uniref:Secreted protein n=1 Tax=Nonomuraea endophytica TaxID=714136 RepID=A0A7W7ZZ17_9ACTN|nr:hypothetical protein [Nonomuraea endophytica]MBB5076364.1 hypothetical protein [Nonomuraea endophytica]
MRLRQAAVALAVVLTAMSTAPAPAFAAEGEFSYTFVGLDGTPQRATLSDPESWECITLPEVADPDASQPAHSPRNRTTSTATVFTGPECDGDYFTLRPVVGRGGERLKLRSVVFS